MKRTNYFIIVIAIGAVIIGIPLISVFWGGTVKNLVIAFALALFAVRLEVFDWKYAVKFACSVWAGFQVMLVMCTILQEGLWWTLRAIHAGPFARVILRA
jgi:hypothetical protein